MAITIHGINNIDGDATKNYEFCGLSTDSKPTMIDGKPVEVNSLFWELNTNTFYYLKTASSTTDVVFNEQTIESSDWQPAGNAYMKMPTSYWENGLTGTVNFVWDGVEYTLEKQDGGLDYGYYGAYVDLDNYIGDFSVYPFGFYLNNEDGTANIIVSKDNEDHTYKAYGQVTTDGEWEELGK